MAPAQKVTKSQGTPTKKQRATNPNEQVEQDLLFLWAYFQQADRSVGAHQAVANAWGISKNAAYKRFNRLKDSLEKKEELRKQAMEELQTATEAQELEQAMEGDA